MEGWAMYLPKFGYYQEASHLQSQQDSHLLNDAANICDQKHNSCMDLLYVIASHMAPRVQVN